MKTKYLILVFAIILFFYQSSINYCKTIDNKSNYTAIIFFHGKYRCSIEQTIEKLTKSTVESNFANDIKNGKIKLSIIDYDKKGNNHYIEDFKLINQAVILVKHSRGKIAQWKNCEKIWDYADNEAKFDTYLTNEIKKFRK